jgi:hypothetical protein
MSNRTNAARQYLTNLVVTYEALEEERQTLLQAATRITAIQAEKAEIIADAQEALDKYNALEGTSYTLIQVRDMFSAKPPVIPPLPEPGPPLP